MSKKVKNILVLGDSYIYGHGCSDREHWVDDSGKEYGNTMNLYGPPSEFAWPSILANRFPDRVNVYNLSMSGIDNLSLTSTLFNFLDSAKVNVDLIIFNSSPPARMLIGNTTENSYKATPFLLRMVDLTDQSKSPNWQVFRESKPIAIRPSPYADEAFLKFAGQYYHDGFGVQMAMSAVLSVYSVSQILGTKFIWMSPHYCAATMNMGLFPQKVRNVLTGHQCIHIADFQRRDIEKYSAADLHSNEQCHEDYFNEVVKAKIASLGMF